MASSESFIFSVKSLAVLHLCFVACRPTIFYAAVDICVGIDVVTKVTRDGLIDLLVAVAALTYLGARWVVVVA